MSLDYPFGFDARGRSAATNAADHVRDLIEQVLFTAPGERVNRPSFGSGLLGLVFEPGGDALAAATQLSIQAALQQWLGEIIQVDDVAVAAEEGTLSIEVRYTVRRTQERRVASFARGGAA
jgi:phage baseplate assembly protein W